MVNIKYSTVESGTKSLEDMLMMKFLQNWKLKTDTSEADLKKCLPVFEILSLIVYAVLTFLTSASQCISASFKIRGANAIC